MTNGWGRVLDRVVADLRELPDDARLSYARALRDSIRLDDPDTPRPPSPRDLAERYGVSLRGLLRSRVVVGKSEAFEFFERAQAGVPRSRLEKLLTARRYREVFGRPVTAKVGKRLIFTYSEALLLIDRPVRLELPPELMGLINE